MSTLARQMLEARALLARLEEADLVRLALAPGRGGLPSELLLRLVRAELVRRRREDTR